ncbi:MAG: ATP-grasp domain-containing protein [Erysipelotrichales bacterium]|nr:ATP-grasp domain-containing protein [Erysipelotrichales bacterium]MBQ4375515.1 ATP-grasp domain-containing protein [Erysipelotrichales bacterium]
MEKEKKRLLILGSIPYLIDAVQKAQKRGIEVYVADNHEDGPAKAYADKPVTVDVTDIEALKELCVREKIDGVFTGYADSLLPYYARLCEEMHYPAYGKYENFVIMTNKKKFKELCREYNVPTIPEYTMEDALNGNVEFPVVVKPIDSAGSRGITVCHNHEELKKGIDFALSYSPSKQILIERYMQGNEIVGYYYFQNGNPVFALLCDRYTDKYSDTLAPLPIIYKYPSIHTQEFIDAADKELKNMFRSIGMENGPLFLQGFFENGKPYFYEPGHRLAGAREHCILNDTVGVNSEDMLLNFALTGKLTDDNLEEKCDPFLKGKQCVKLSPSLKRGTITKITGAEEMRAHPNVKFLHLNHKVGDTITSKQEGTLFQLAYRAYIVADSFDEMLENIEMVQNTIHFYDENGEDMIISKVDTNRIVR